MNQGYTQIMVVIHLLVALMLIHIGVPVLPAIGGLIVGNVIYLFARLIWS